jgi:hypothetical protein
MKTLVRTNVWIFLVSALLNIPWEITQTQLQLYENCANVPLRTCMPLLLVMSVKDGFFILLFYLLTVWLFRNEKILERPLQLVTFVLIALSFAFIDETVSLRLGRWAYTSAMPTVFGAGVTPLLELATTGVVALFLVFGVFSRKWT